MLFAPKERGQALADVALILATIFAAYILLAWIFCWWPFNNNARCKATPF